jgi:hypothetical protein
MESIDFLQLVAAILTIALLIRGARRFDRHWPQLLQQLRREVRHIAVYSAETLQGLETEFVRDRLPTKFPAMLILLMVLAWAAVTWWLSR